MGQEPAKLTPDLSPWHHWGAELRQFRNARALSLEELGSRVHVTRSYLSKIERGQRSARRDFAISCDQALDLAGALVSAWDQAAASSGGSSGLTNDRSSLHVSSPGAHVSNSRLGLAFADSSQPPSDDVGITVPCRLRDGRMSFVTVPRREFLRGGVSLGAAAILGLNPESSLPRVKADAYGPTPIEHFQKLRRVLIDSDNLMGPGPVIPAVHQSIRSIQALRAESSGSDRRQLLELQTQYAEFASWLHQDTGDYQSSQYWLDRALPWSYTVGNNELTSYVMARKSQLAGEMRDVLEIVDLAEASQNMARPGTRLTGIGQTYAAFGHALLGNASESERAFDQALLVAENTAAEPSPWGGWLDSSYIEVHRAQAWEVLGKHEAAATAFAFAIRQLPEEYHRDRGVYMAREAVAHAGAGVPEHAAQVGLQALTVAHDTGSGRILNELARLDTALDPWTEVAEVADFRTSLNEIVFHQT